MVLFLVEAYCSAEELADRKSDLALVADAIDLTVTPPARLVHAVFVPEDEACFYLFEATSAEAVLDAADRMRLRFERLTEAILAWPDSLDDEKAHGDFDPSAIGSRSDRRPRDDQSREVSPLSP